MTLRAVDAFLGMPDVHLDDIRNAEKAAIGWTGKAAVGVENRVVKNKLRLFLNKLKPAVDDMMPGNRDEDLDYSTLEAIEGAKRNLEAIDDADLWPQEKPYDYYSCIFNGADPLRHGGKQCPMYNNTTANNALEATQLLLNQAHSLLAQQTPDEHVIASADLVEWD
jgi:hypothetical protein